MRISELENKLRKHAETTKSVMQAPFDLNEEIKNRKFIYDVTHDISVRWSKRVHNTCKHSFLIT